MQFFAAVICGVAAYLYKMMNYLPNWDSLACFNSDQEMTYVGRFLLKYADGITSRYDLFFLNCAIAIVLIGVTSAVICEILRVERKTTASLIGAMLTVHPSIISTMYYSYTVHGYMVALLLSVIAGLILVQGKKRILSCCIAALLIAASMGIYQSYVSVMIVLLMLRFYRDLLVRGSEIKGEIIVALEWIASAIIGAVLYYTLMRVALLAQGTELSSYLHYKGLNCTNILTTIVTCYKTVILFLLSGGKKLNVYSVINILIGSLSALLAMKTWGKIISDKKMPTIESIARICLGLIVVICIPVGCTILRFCGARYHTIMETSFIVFYLQLIIQYEELSKEQNRNAAVLTQWSVLGLSSAVIFYFILQSNICASIMTITYEKSYAVAMRIADRIEQMDEYLECDEIAIIGTLPDAKQYSIKLNPPIIGTTDELILTATDEGVEQEEVLTYMLRDVLDMNLHDVSKDKKNELEETETVKGMTVWPDKQSVQMVDGVIVLKLESK